MIIATVDNAGRMRVYSSESGRIVSGQVGPIESGPQESSGDHSRPATHDRQLDSVLALLHHLIEKVTHMSQTQDTIKDEVAALKQNMTDLHGAVSGIQSRLDAALAKGPDDASVLADLHSVNDDLKSVVAGLAPPAASQPAQPAPADQPAQPPVASDQPVVVSDQPEPPQPAAAPTFNAADPTPNSEGGRNTSGLPGFDATKPETT